MFTRIKQALAAWPTLRHGFRPKPLHVTFVIDTVDCDALVAAIRRELNRQAVGLCSRGHHDGPCNGFPTRDCNAFRDHVGVVVK